MINHLLFVNDSLIFCKANSSESQKLLNLLENYAMALGQRINTGKTIMIFSWNVKERDKTEIIALWETSNQQNYDKYLGLPPIIERSWKKDIFGCQSKDMEMATILER